MRAPARELPEEPAETLGQPHVGLQPLDLFRRHRRVVHRIAYDARAQELAHAGGGVDADELLGLGRRRGDMRGGDHLGQAGEGTGRRGFVPEDVQPGAADLPGRQPFDQRRLVDEVAPRRVDDADVPPAAGQELAVHEPARRLG